MKKVIFFASIAVIAVAGALVYRSWTKLNDDLLVGTSEPALTTINQ